MRKAITIAALAAIGIGAADLALGQGPVREGLRRTGEAAANITRGAAEGAVNAARGVGEVAAGTLRATGDALTPGTPHQARPGANLSALDAGRDARWRFSRHNGEWWYYTPDNQWMYHRDGDWRQFSQDSFEPSAPAATDSQLAHADAASDAREHSTGYRGVDPGQPDQSQAHEQPVMHHGASQTQEVRYDRCGRAFICENGRPVYLHDGDVHGQQQGAAQADPGQSPTPAVPEEHSAARQNLDQPSSGEPTPATPAEAGATGDASAEANVPGDAAAASGDTAPPAAATPALPQATQPQ